MKIIIELFYKVFVKLKQFEITVEKVAYPSLRRTSTEWRKTMTACVSQEMDHTMFKDIWI